MVAAELFSPKLYPVLRPVVPGLKPFSVVPPTDAVGTLVSTPPPVDTGKTLSFGSALTADGSRVIAAPKLLCIAGLVVVPLDNPMFGGLGKLA